jgi:hypothetical protein
MRKVSRHGVQGATFGVMEASIMMLGVLLGLSVTQNKIVIIIGILSAGVADALANAASFYVSEESEKIHTKKEVFRSAKMCFLGTVGTVAAIAVPLIVVQDLVYSISASFAVGIVILFFLGRYMSKELKSKTPAATIIKYILIGVITAVVCFLVAMLVEYIANGF